MITIWKYEFPEEMQGVNTYGEFEIEVPLNTILLYCNIQNGKRCVWCEVDTEMDLKCQMKLQLVGTGKQIKEKYEHHIGTFMQDVFVWHLFAFHEGFWEDNE